MDVGDVIRQNWALPSRDFIWYGPKTEEDNKMKYVSLNDAVREIEFQKKEFNKDASAIIGSFIQNSNHPELYELLTALREHAFEYFDIAIHGLEDHMEHVTLDDTEDQELAEQFGDRIDTPADEYIQKPEEMSTLEFYKKRKKSLSVSGDQAKQIRDEIYQPPTKEQLEWLENIKRVGRLVDEMNED